MFEDAIEYPWRGEQHVETLAIGGVMTILGLFFVPILFVYGYLVRVLRAVSAGETATPPTFDEWGDLLVDGVVAFGIGVVYFLVPMVVMVVGWFFSFIPALLGVGAGSDGGAAAGSLLSVLVLVGVFGVTGALFLAAGYLLPGAITAYARTGTVGSAFSASTLRPVVTDREYAIAWLVAFAINLLVGIVVNLAVVTIVGIVVVPFLNFYGQVACAYAIGAGVGETELGPEPSDEVTAV